ncbi:hypothetical protein L3Q82_002764 [Scortum barcoo]|uniref:Uncharacterized protein n=1 Tax=Scortum barcoo TaxID=214431 RepID=A0ACB8VUW9_9TELE|nr:hypothetical protein L3Q82_002764 [Scortum barcoo]
MLACVTIGQFDLKEILANRLAPQAGGTSTLPTLFTVQGGGAVDLNWGHCRTVKEYFEDLLNPTDMPAFH